MQTNKILETHNTHKRKETITYDIQVKIYETQIKHKNKIIQNRYGVDKIMFSGDGREGANYTKHRSQGSESLTWYLFGDFR